MLLSLLRNIRFYILLLSFTFSVAIYLWIASTIPDGSLQIIRLTQIYAFSAITCLYFALLAGPFCYQMRWFPFRSQYIKARRGIGVSAFYFGLLHACFAFFGQLGGFAGLGFLNSKYLIAISLSFTALVILGAMALTSMDNVIAWMSFRRWKFIHRFVYLAGILIIIHALMLGTHFQDLSGVIPQVAFALLAFLFLLEARRVDAFLEKKLVKVPQFGFITLIVCSFAMMGAFYYFFPFSSGNGVVSLGIHAQHIQLAKEAQQNTAGDNAKSLSNIPSLQGDKSKRFTVSFKHPDKIPVNQDTDLSFQIFDAANGNQALLFQKVYEKGMHLIIVDNTLTYFSHIHPEQDANEFAITTQFPKDGVYHLYLNFQPFGAIEQQFAFSVAVGDGQNITLSDAQPDSNLTKAFGDYMVTLQFPQPLLASKLSTGEQILTFTVRDAKGYGVATLKPYLGAFGHLVMINKETFDYLHVHPNRLTAPAPDENGGPTVEFMPLGLYGAIKPGIYRMFAQFNPDGKLFTADFTVSIE